MAPGLLGVPWLIWAAVCLAVAGVYAVVVPRPKRAGATGAPSPPAWRRLVLRWAHALVWLLLATSCLLRAAGLAGAVPNAVALAALPLYGLFLVTFLGARARP